jgi:hypothetical protein
LATVQDVKRLEGISTFLTYWVTLLQQLLFAARAPVFSHVSASLYGLPTIRSANAQGMIINEFDSLQDQHSGSWFLFIASSETFGFYLDIISMVFLTIVTYQFLIFDDGNSLRTRRLSLTSDSRHHQKRERGTGHLPELDPDRDVTIRRQTSGRRCQQHDKRRTHPTVHQTGQRGTIRVFADEEAASRLAPTGPRRLQKRVSELRS